MNAGAACELVGAEVTGCVTAAGMSADATVSVGADINVVALDAASVGGVSDPARCTFNGLGVLRLSNIQKSRIAAPNVAVATSGDTSARCGEQPMAANYAY